MHFKTGTPKEKLHDVLHAKINGAKAQTDAPTIKPLRIQELSACI